MEIFVSGCSSGVDDSAGGSDMSGELKMAQFPGATTFPGNSRLGEFLKSLGRASLPIDTDAVAFAFSGNSAGYLKLF